MSKAFEKIPSLKKFYTLYKTLSILEAAAGYLTSLLGLFFILLLVMQFDAAERFRKIFILFFIGLAAGGLYFIARSLKKSLTLKNLCLILLNNAQDFGGLLTGVEFASFGVREGVSADLAEGVIQEVEAKLEPKRPQEWISKESLKLKLKYFASIVLIFAVSAVFPPNLFQSGWDRLAYGLDHEIARHLKVSPEGGNVVKGSPVTIQVELLQNSVQAPHLLVKSSSGWDEAKADGGPLKFIFVLSNVYNKTEFKVRWQNLETRNYVLEPVEPVRLSGFEVTLKPPAYTGEKEQILKEEPRIHAYRGTEVLITAEATGEIDAVKFVSEEGVTYPVDLKRNKIIKTAFKVQNPFKFWFELTDNSGVALDIPTHYSVTIKEDEFPRVQILAPSDDLLVGQESKIPFTFELSDDLGVGNVFLNIEQSETPSKSRFVLKKYDPPLKQKIDEASAGLSGLKTHSGEIIKMRLEVQDNDTVTGPKSGFSEWITVEIRSYEKEHEALEKDLKDFSSDVIDLLSEQTLAAVAKKDWDKFSADPGALNNKTEETLQAQKKVAESAEKIEKKLGTILDKMERDPLSDYSVWSEHKALKEALEETRKDPMERASKALQEKKYDAASDAQDEAVSRLERLSNLSEQISKYAKMKDLMHAADRLEEKGHDLEQKLSANPPMSEALKKELQDTLNEAMKVLSEIEKSLKDLPKELPEDFVNKPAVKDIKLNEMANSIQSLSDALKQNDARSALKAAQDLLKQAKAARDSLAKAADETSSSADDFLSESSDAMSGQIDKIAGKQQDLLDKTSPFESKRKERQTEQQKKILQDLAAKQRKVIEDSSLLIRDISNNSNRVPYLNAMLAGFSQSLPKMEKVYKELSEKNILFSHKWLEEIVQTIQPGVKAQESFYAASHSTSVPDALLVQLKESVLIGDKARTIEASEKEILESLKNPPKQDSSSAPGEEQGAMKALGGQQQSIDEEAEKLAGNISKLGNRSALVKPEMLDSVKKARQEMKNSKDSLSKGDSEGAVLAQEKALSHLRKGQSMMQEMGESLDKSRSTKGQGQTGMIQRRNQPGGTSGMRHAAVRIPGASEYVPPKEFREEILESLKEKYPASEEGLIKDYFKRLTQ